MEHKHHSISRKYSRGYLLLLIMLMVAMAVSLAAQVIVVGEYNGIVANIMEINELFVHIDGMNRELFNYYTYLLSQNRSNYLEQKQALLERIASIEAGLDKHWSRDVMDLCATARTYLEQGDKLVSLLLQDSYANGSASSEAARAAYADTQATISYINLNFKDIYSAKLAETSIQQGRIRSIAASLIAVQICLVLAGCVICFRYYRLILKDVKQSLDTLTEFAKTVQEHRPMPVERVHLDTDDEIAVFADTFNQMLDTIETQMRHLEENAEIRERLQQVEMENLRTSNALQSTQMRLLQSRINPHFLFNTLSTISAMAEIEGAERSVELIEITASFLRYNLDRLTHAVTLDDEMENARNYVTIQQSRFGKQFAFHFDVDPACGALIMPCMILQPLIENALMHGIRDMGSGGAVWIRSRLSDSQVLLEIEDNGVGFQPELLCNILQRLSTVPLSEESSHLGLRNIYQRLMIYFQGNMSFDVNSMPGSTCVRIVLPMEAEERRIGAYAKLHSGDRR